MNWKTALACLLVLSASSANSAPAASSANRPSVVLVVADQWRAQAVGYAGDPNARTPCLDRLAGEGVTLSTCVSTCPVCSPYRASLLTGRYPLSHGVFVNDVPLSHDAVSLADAFRQAGYRTAVVGKWHVDGHGRMSFIPPERRQGFEFWRVCECTHDYNHSLYYADTPEKLYWKGYDAAAQTDEACQYIRRHGSEPFLLLLTWGPPHNPYPTAPEEFRRLFKPGGLKLRPNVPPEVAAAARRDLAGYYAHCAALDDCLARIRATLRDCGLADNTILAVTSDHGDMLGSHGEERKQRPWDEAVLVPFLLRWPAGLGTSPRRLAAPFSSPEIMPTLLGLCGIAVPSTVEGDDRSAWLRGKMADADHDALVCCITPFGEWVRSKGGREYRGLRTRRYTYVRTLDGPWLFYDNERDPYQQHNLVGDAAHAAVQASLESRLAAELKRRHDDFRPGKEYLDKWHYTTDATGTVPVRP